MATVTHRVATAAMTNVESYTSGSFTPTVGDLLVVMGAVGASTAAGSATASANGITFTQVETAVRGGIDTQYLYVADQLVPSSPASMTVTVEVTGDAGTGAVVFVASVGGMTRTGASAVLQSEAANAASGTPAVTFPSTPTAGNPQIAFMQNVTNPAGLTPPSGFTEPAGGDTGYNTPAKGAEYAYLAAGNTTAAVTWGSSSASAWSALVAELDASAAGATVAPVDAFHANTADSPTVTQVHVVSPADAFHGNSTDQPAVTQVHVVAPVDAFHGNAADVPTVTQTHVVAPVDTAHGNSADSPTVTQVHVIAPADSAHGHTADSPTVTAEGGADAAPVDAFHAHAADSPTVTQVHVIVPADTTHAHAADTLTLTQVHILTPDGVTSLHTADSPTVTQLHTIAPLDAFHAHAADEPSVTSGAAAEPTPTERIYVIEAETRAATAQPEARTLTITDPRTATVTPESRTLAIT